MKHHSLALAVLMSGVLILYGCGEDEPTGPSNGSPQNGAPSVPTSPTPANNATNVAVPVMLSWNASAGATRYTLQVSTSSSFTSFVYNDTNLTSASQQVNGLNNETTYCWRVSASNTYGTSGWSMPAWQFTTAIAGPCPGTPTVSWGGKTYNTVLIGTQCWFRENLDIGTMVPGSQNQTNNGTTEKYCYNDSLVNCATYGGLYKWDEAVQYDTTQGAQGICPPGWHIPTLAEFQTLSNAVGGDGNALKAIGQGTGGGAGTSTSGFSALLAGYRYGNGDFLGLGYYGLFWSSTQGGASFAHNLYLGSYVAGVSLYRGHRAFGFSVRCIED